MLCMHICLCSPCNQMVILGHCLDAKPFLNESMLVASLLWTSGNLFTPPNCNELVE